MLHALSEVVSERTDNTSTVKSSFECYRTVHSISEVRTILLVRSKLRMLNVPFQKQKSAGNTIFRINRKVYIRFEIFCYMDESIELVYAVFPAAPKAEISALAPCSPADHAAAWYENCPWAASLLFIGSFTALRTDPAALLTYCNYNLGITEGR